MLRKKTFAPEFCSLISNWFDMREQAPGANLLHESVSGASLRKFVGREMTCKTREQNTFSLEIVGAEEGACCKSVLREQAPSSCPSCVGVLTRERVSGPCLRSKLPRGLNGRYDNVAQYIYWQLCGKCGLERASSLHEQKPEGAVESENFKILWNCTIQ